MKRMTKIAVAVGAALSLGLAAAVAEAQPYGMGWGGGGHMGGYAQSYGMGPGMMGDNGSGYGMGNGMGPGYGPGADYSGMHGYGMGTRGMINGYAGTAEQRSAGLKQELGITAEQEPAWQAFVNSEKKQDEDRQAWLATMREAHAAGSAPELLAQQTECMKPRQVEMEAAATSLKSLYETLTQEQKAIADQRFGGYGQGYSAGYGRGYRGGQGAGSR